MKDKVFEGVTNRLAGRVFLASLAYFLYGISHNIVFAISGALVGFLGIYTFAFIIATIFAIIKFGMIITLGDLLSVYAYLLVEYARDLIGLPLL